MPAGADDPDARPGTHPLGGSRHQGQRIHQAILRPQESGSIQVRVVCTRKPSLCYFNFSGYHDIQNRVVDDNCGTKLKVYTTKLRLSDVYCKGKYFME